MTLKCQHFVRNENKNENTRARSLQIHKNDHRDRERARDTLQNRRPNRQCQTKKNE